MNVILLSKPLVYASGAPTDSSFQPAQYAVTDTAQVTHIREVLRATVGDTLKVGELGGKLGQAVIADIDEAQVILADVILDESPPSKLDLTIVLALPRPKVLRRLIMDMTAIGVQRIVLVNSYRTQKSYWQSPMLNRLDEFVQEGLQQGVDTIPPIIQLENRFKPFVEDTLVNWTTTQSAVAAHPYASESLSHYQQAQGLPQIICIGAEGGWIDYEVALLQANGCAVVEIGARILRVEAAVNVLCGRYL